MKQRGVQYRHPRVCLLVLNGFPPLVMVCRGGFVSEPLARFVLAISRLRPLCFADRRVDADACPPDEVACLQCPNGFTADYLREELARRNLDATGSKEEIISRLIADIAPNRSTTPPLPSPDSAASTQRCNITPLPPSPQFKSLLFQTSPHRFLHTVETTAFQRPTGLKSWNELESWLRGNLQPYSPSPWENFVEQPLIGKPSLVVNAQRGKPSDKRS
ncbi:hypothetical protein HPB49_019486 [Dermacentor silvarum]|uniref:Uncharacterized protein n=1 Tax=Dermacentor silvarum TaxID=543639 RepID=A0ACB8DFM2_DERSI|nr:hypothetical protein HPB49_019486 [Dermacentor silvarum]